MYAAVGSGTSLCCTAIFTSPEPVTYALMRSFSHASNGISHAPLYHITLYVLVTGVLDPRPLKTRDLEAGTCMVNGSQPASLMWTV